MRVTLTIATIDLTAYLLHGWSIERTANGRGIFHFRFISQDGAYHPALDAEVTLTDNDHGPPLLFGGYITNAPEAGYFETELGVGFVTNVTCADFNAWASRRYVFVTIPAGSTLKQAATLVYPYVANALDPAQVTGPTLPNQLIYDGVKGEDVLNDLTIQSGGYVWNNNSNKNLLFWTPGSMPAPFDIATGSVHLIGDARVESIRSKDYANYVIVRNATLTAVATDPGEYAAKGAYEILVIAPDSSTQAEMDALAALILAQSLPTLKKVEYVTKTAGLVPGMSQGIVIPRRGVNNTFLLTDVNMHGVENDVEFEITAMEGLIYKTGWRQTYKDWSQSSSQGVTVVGSGGGGGGTGTIRYAWPLGTGIEGKRSPTPTWVPATGDSPTLGAGAVHVQINTVPRGTLQANVVVRLRSFDAGVTVQARLYDVTAGAACPGTSASVNSTTFETKVFTATLTAGSHFYELQLLPGTANKDVAGSGYVE